MVDAVVGVVAKTGSAVAVTVTDWVDDPSLADRRSLSLCPDGTERFVYHAAQDLRDNGRAARDFVQRCERAIARRTCTAVDALLRELRRNDVLVVRGAIVSADKPFATLGLDRVLASHALVHGAEGNLYRSVVVDAFDRHGIAIEPIPRSEVAGRAPGTDSVIAAIGRAAGPPWRKEHKDATLAALAAAALTG
jgi:hypothetical protein